MRTQGDELVCSCCLFPSDGVRRAALSDWLRENNEEVLADTVSGDKGDALLRATMIAANHFQRQPTVAVLFAVRFVFDIARLLRPVVAIHHPPGQMNPADPSSESNQEVAFRLAQAVNDGSILVIPDVRNSDGEPAWRVQFSSPDWAIARGLPYVPADGKP